MKVTLQADDGREYDITQHFQVMYDQLVNGMDWGSGFLSAGEALVVMQAGVAAGFEINLYDEGIPKEAYELPQPDEGRPYNYFDEAAKKRWKDWSDANEKRRTQWIKDNLGDPITWDSIAAYRERLQEMENSE